MSEDGVKNLKDLLGSGIKRGKYADSDITYQDSEQLIKAKEELEKGKRRRIRTIVVHTSRDL